MIMQCENLKIFVSLRFYVKSILNSKSAKTAVFAIIRAVNFVDSKSAKIHKNQNSEPLDVEKV